MTNLYARKLEKIFNNVSKIASKGKDNRLEYFNYINELIDKSDYSAFKEMLLLFFEIDVNDSTDVDFVKSSTWDEICFQTKTPFMAKLSKLYKQKNIYQQSYNIYSDDYERLQIILSEKLSATYSLTGLSSSISFEKNGGIIDLYVNDVDIQSVQIQKADWEIVNGIEQPTNIRWVQDFGISYLGNSFTTFNPSQLTVGDRFTMSLTTTKQYVPDQKISVTFSGNYLEGTIESYNSISGDCVIDITSLSGSSTYSLWVVDYLSGPKSPTFSTSISTVNISDYLITTIQKNDITFEFEKFNYKLKIIQDPLLGQIYEVDTYSPNAQYYLKNAQYARLIGERKTYLQAIKNGETQGLIFDLENPSLSDDQNLLNRYKSAIDYLLS